MGESRVASPSVTTARGDAFALTDKTILLLSPQSWGPMRISKHHYAIELARRGNRVFFVNPPAEDRFFGRRAIEVRPVPDVPGLSIVDHRLGVPYALKFHARPAFRLAMWPHVRALLATLGQPVDIVWSFDISWVYPLHSFAGAGLRILHPVDDPTDADRLGGATGADVLFSVTKEILQGYAHSRVPGHFINHGLPVEFLELTDGRSEPHEGVRVGFSGNLLRSDIDREVFLQIVREHHGVTFECWGTYASKGDNLGGPADMATVSFIDTLKSLPNVVLHGAVSTQELVKGYRRMDCFLISYDVQRDHSHGTNYHKVMEFLATGKTIVSNNVTTYAARPDLVRMVEERTHNHELPALFREVLADLAQQNAPALVQTRTAFARDNTYARQVDRIATILAGFSR